MKKNDPLIKFENQLLTLLRSFTTGDSIIASGIRDEIKKIFYRYKDDINKNYLAHELLIDKLNQRKIDEVKNSINILNKLNNKFILRKEKINIVRKNNILISENEINRLKNNLENKINELNDKCNNNIQKVKENIFLINKAKDLNIESFNNKLLKTENDYAAFLDQKYNETVNNIQKIHAFYSRKIMMSSEEGNQSLLLIDNTINQLENEIKTIEQDLLTSKYKIRQNEILADTNLNNLIREKLKKKVDSTYNLRKNNFMKQTDVKKQLSFHEEKYNEKVQKIIDDYVNVLKENDELDNINETDYKNSLERIKRNFFYDYYYLNNELNDFLKNIQDEVNDSFKLKLANRKLIKLKTKSYYQKIKELKENYKSDVSIITNKYNQTKNRHKLARNINEINKNYELEIARIEFNTIKANNSLLNNFIEKQLTLNINDVDNEYEYAADMAHNNKDRKIAELKKETSTIECHAELELIEKKRQILNLKADKKRITETIKLTTNYYNTASTLSEKLEQIISNLELDRNAKIKEYNNKLTNAKTDILNNYVHLQQDLITSKIEYISQITKLNIKLKNDLFNKDKSPFDLDIKINKIKQEHDLKFEEIYFTKNNGLAILNHNRKNYRFDSVLIAKNGNLMFYLTKTILDFFNEVYDLIYKKLYNYDKAYINFFKILADLIFNLYGDILKSFNINETLILEQRIQTETKNTYKTKANNLLMEFNSVKYYLDKQIESLNNTLIKYDNTLIKYRNEIVNLTNKENELKAKTSIFQHLFSYEILNVKNDIKLAKNSIKEIKKKKIIVNNLLKECVKKANRTQKKYDKATKKNDLLLKLDYASSYSLVSKANNLVKKTNIKFNKLNNYYFKIKNIDKLIKNKNLFNDLNKILKYNHSLYLKFFNKYKKDNEINYQNTQKNIIKKFNIDLKKEFKSKQKRIIICNLNYNSIKNERANGIIKTKEEIENNISLYYKEISDLKLSYKKQIAKNNENILKLKRLYTDDLYSISDNISFLRKNYSNNIKKNDKSYLIFKKEIRNNFIKDTNLNNNNYNLNKIKIINDLNNIPITYNKNIKELNKQVKIIKENYKNNKNKHNLLKKMIKKEYDKNRIENISNDTTKLVNEKINQNLELKKEKKKV